MAEKKRATAPKKKDNHTREWAKLMFLKENMTQKDIALRIGVNENTIRRWKEDGKWEDLKTRISVNRENELRSMYHQWALLNKQNTELLEDGDPDTNPNYDELRKLTKSIHEMESESEVGELYTMCMDVLTFIQRENLEHAQLFTAYFDAYIKERLNQSA